MAQTRFRVGGAYTRIAWGGQTLAYVDVINETAPKAVAQAQTIQPLDQEYPIEIAFPGALEAGMLEVTFREQWNTEVWNAFYSTYNDPLTGEKNIQISDLLGIFKAQLQQGNLKLQKFIVDPTTGSVTRTINYQNPTIVGVMIDERVNIGSMTFPKSVTFMYTQRIETYANGGNPVTGSLVQPTNSFDTTY